MVFIPDFDLTAQWFVSPNAIKWRLLCEDLAQHIQDYLYSCGFIVRQNPAKHGLFTEVDVDVSSVEILSLNAQEHPKEFANILLELCQSEKVAVSVTIEGNTENLTFS